MKISKFSKTIFALAIFTFFLLKAEGSYAQFTNINLTGSISVNNAEPSVVISHFDTSKAVITFYSGTGSAYCYTTNGGLNWLAPLQFETNINLSNPSVCVDNAGKFFISETDTTVRIYKS